MSTSACCFLHHPAELRNLVYAFLTDDGPFAKCLILQPPNDGGISLRSPNLPAITQVCKQLRNEYLPLWMAEFNVDVAAKNLAHFLDTFCRTTTCIDGTMCTLCPRRIIVSIPDHDDGVNAIPDSSIDLLPLFELRSKAPDLACLFALEQVLPKLGTTRHNRRSRHERAREVESVRVTVAVADITSLMQCNNETWIALARSKRLSQVLLHPYATGYMTHIELVFLEQPEGIMLGPGVKRFYVPVLSLLGLGDVYRNSYDLSFGARMGIEGDKKKSDYWSSTMLGRAESCDKRGWWKHVGSPDWDDRGCPGGGGSFGLSGVHEGTMMILDIRC